MNIIPVFPRTYLARKLEVLLIINQTRRAPQYRSQKTRTRSTKRRWSGSRLGSGPSTRLLTPLAATTWLYPCTDPLLDTLPWKLTADAPKASQRHIWHRMPCFSSIANCRSRGTVPRHLAAPNFESRSLYGLLFANYIFFMIA